jgi:DNA polymerase-3 subunit alpha
VIRKYGASHVARIVAFDTLKARAALRDVARVMAIPYATADAVAKQVDPTMTLEQAVRLSKTLGEQVAEDAQLRRLFELAKKLEGMPRHVSIHAAGVVITARPVCEYVPLCLCGEAVATQYTMTTLEELGLLKMDFLGLRNLTVIAHAEEAVRQIEPSFSVADIPLDSAPVYDMLSAGNCEGVFQMESAGMKRVLTNLKPDRFDDLIAVISLYRPGPMDSIPKYIQNRHHPEQVTYAHPRLEPFLRVTYGCIVYQEQLLQVFRELAGYSLGRADIVRRPRKKPTCWNANGRSLSTVWCRRTARWRWRAVCGAAFRRRRRKPFSTIFPLLLPMRSTNRTRYLTHWSRIRPPISNVCIRASIWRRC